MSPKEAVAKAPGGDPACCPELEPCDVCDTLDFYFDLPFQPVVPGTTAVPIPVIVTLHFRLTRCSGPLSLGDILYSTTLLPGETVKLFTSDRHSRFSFDSETSLAYRQQTTSEESFFMSGMANAVNNVSINENASTTSSSHSSAVGGGGGAGIDLGFFTLGGSASGSSYDASSASKLAENLSQHADSSSRSMEVSTRAASSTQVGEVSTRVHTESESEDQYEASSRTFTNPNRCHALTYLFYKLNKCQTITWELVGIDRRVDDPAAPTGVSTNDPAPFTGVTVIPDGVLATAANRLTVEQAAQASTTQSDSTLADALSSRLAFAAINAQPIAIPTRAGALEAVDSDLVAQGLLTAVGGTVAKSAQTLLGWTRQVALPTAGVIVKGCLDDCDTCEPSLAREIELDLQRKTLENELLAKRIELLAQSQEYRCCPDGEEAATT